MPQNSAGLYRGPPYKPEHAYETNLRGSKAREIEYRVEGRGQSKGDERSRENNR